MFKKKNRNESNESNGEINTKTEVATLNASQSGNNGSEKRAMENSIFNGDENFRIGNFSEAMVQYEAALDETVDCFGHDDVRVALVYGRMAKALFSHSKEENVNEKDTLERSKALFYQTINILKLKLGGDHDETLLVQKELDAVNARLEVMQTYSKHSKLQDVDDVPDEPDRDSKTAVLDEISVSDDEVMNIVKLHLQYDHKGEHAKAISILEKALHTIMPVCDERISEAFDILVAIGNIYFYQGKEHFNKSYGCYKGAILIAEKYGLVVEWKKQVHNLSNMGRICCDYGDLLAAHNFFCECITIYSSQSEECKNKMEYASLLNNAGNVSYKLCKFEEAKDHYLQSMNIKKVIFGESHLSIVGVKTNIGMTCLEMHNVDEAMKYFDEARLMVESAKEDFSTEFATACINLGNAYRSIGNNDAASNCFWVILDLKDHLGDQNAQILTAKMLLGYIEFSRGNNDEALEFYRDCLLKSTDAVQKSMTLYGMGNVFAKQGDLKNALESYEKALDLEKGTRSFKAVSKTLQNIGNVHRKLKDFNKAKQYFDEAKAARGGIVNAVDLVDTVKLIIDMGKVQIALENYISARECFAEAETLLRESSQFPATKKLENLVSNFMKKADILSNK